MDLRTLIVSPEAAAGAAGVESSGYFFVLGQINRQGCVFTVCVSSFTFCPVAFKSGPRLFMVDFSFSDESRKFSSVT